MNMLNFRVLFILFFSDDPFEVWLAELVSAAGASSPKLHTGFCHCLFNSITEFRIRLIDYQVKSVVTASLKIEVRPVFFRIKVC